MFIGLKVVRPSSRGVSWREVHKYRFFSGLAANHTSKGSFQMSGDYPQEKIETYRTEDINPLPFFTKLKTLKKEEKHGN